MSIYRICIRSCRHVKLEQAPPPAERAHKQTIEYRNKPEAASVASRKVEQVSRHQVRVGKEIIWRITNCFKQRDQHRRRIIDNQVGQVGSTAESESGSVHKKDRCQSKLESTVQDEKGVCTDRKLSEKVCQLCTKGSGWDSRRYTECFVEGQDGSA